MTSVEVEPMSLATFEPNRAFAPYLNTPRSLEACRLHGVNPIELVEVPVSEFHKDFPNDPEAALRRYDRIDGARRRVLTEVTAEWKRLVSIHWKPQVARPKSAKEAILEVAPEAHCTLLEIQAQRFRKIEQENWNAYERMLRMEVKKADAEVKGKKILGKHEEIAASNDALRKKRMQMREALLQEQRDRQRQKEIEEAERIKALQILDARYALQQAEEEAEKRREMKEANERREADRVAREEYTRQMKDSIFQNLEEKTNNKKRIVEMRDKLISDRLEHNRAQRAKEAEARRESMESRVAKAMEEVRKKEEEERLATEKKLQEQDDYRRELQRQKEVQMKIQEQQDGATKEKLQHILDNKANIVKEKQDKTWKDLQMKEELARQELERVREAQDKRRCIKSIKQESYEIAAARARKAQEYKMMKLTQSLKEKEDRCNAIKKGFTVLNQMRNSMKDIMEKTTNELKTEFHHLRHNDEFSPDTVVDKALKVSDTVLFPRLEKTFGIVDPHANTNKQAFTQSNDMFGFDFDKKKGAANRSGSETNVFGSATAADHVHPGRNNQLSKSMTDLAVAAPTQTSRTNFATMQIQSLTHDRLAAALKESREKYAQADREAEAAAQVEELKRSNRGQSSKKKGKHDRSILKLDPSDYPDEVDEEAEDHHSTSRRSHHSKGSTSGGGGSHSNSPSQRPKTTPGKQQRESSRGSPSPAHSKTGSLTGGGGRGLTNDVVINEDGEINVKFNILHTSDDEASSQGGSARSLTRGGSNSIILEPIQSPDNRPDTTSSGSRKLKKIPSYLKAKPPIRTDVNDKAKYLEVPPGKFRREFSLDHPLAAEGKGNYNVELKKGVTPAGMDVATQLDANVAGTLAVNKKIQKLTYSATNKVVDPEMQLEKIKKEQNEILKQVIAEEKAAEEFRESQGRTVTDPDERDKLESIFAEERRRASDRIISATKTHENTVKQAVLAMMNLGVTLKSK